jgi:hypothetical protein
MKKITAFTRVALVAIVFLCSQNIFAQWTNSTNINNTNSGNVGIGTGLTSPLGKLEVVSDNVLLRLRGTNYSSKTPFEIVNLGLVSSGEGAFNLAFRIGYPHAGGVDAYPKLDLIKVSEGNTVFGTNEAHQPLGNIGIGTRTPSNKVEIYTNSNLQGLNLNHSNQRFVTYFSPSLTGGAYNPITQANDAGIIFGANSGPNTVANGFVIAPHIGVNGGLRILSNGRVGIGTANPGSFQLGVEGTIGAREVNVTAQNPFPDYVFESTYNLLPISQVESFIKVNKHLPEIPSAKEVEANGINLGEMDALLLKKIEELTLYVIKLNEDNGILKERIKVLENAK